MWATWKESYDAPRQCIKKQSYHLADKGPYSQTNGFSSSHVQMWDLDHKEGWVPKIWCFWIVVLEKTLESPLDGKEIKLVCPKGNQHWIFIGTTDTEGETPIFWPVDEKSQSLEKTLMLGKIEGRRWKGVTEDEMIGWHHCSLDMSLRKFQEIRKDREAWRAVVSGVTKNQMWLSD